MRTLVRYLSSVLARLATGLLLLACAGVAVAQQGFPSKTIRIIVPFSPGGTNDILARVRGPKLTEVLGQQVIVDNRPGGNTVIASNAMRVCESLAHAGHAILTYVLGAVTLVVHW